MPGGYGHIKSAAIFPSAFERKTFLDFDLEAKQHRTLEDEIKEKGGRKNSPKTLSFPLTEIISSRFLKNVSLFDNFKNTFSIKFIILSGNPCNISVECILFELKTFEGY